MQRAVGTSSLPRLSTMAIWCMGERLDWGQWNLFSNCSDAILLEGTRRGIFRQTRWACTNCISMAMSGFAIGTTRTTMPNHQSTIPKAR